MPTPFLSTPFSRYEENDEIALGPLSFSSRSARIWSSHLS